jgi:hypothetical protein
MMFLEHLEFRATIEACLSRGLKASTYAPNEKAKIRRKAVFISARNIFCRNETKAEREFQNIFHHTPRRGGAQKRIFATQAGTLTQKETVQTFLVTTGKT